MAAAILPAGVAAPAPMSVFERYLTVWVVRADPILTHPADPILTRGWTPTA
jgi:hypothetical protein